jgi:hypothetical protein
MDTKRYRVPEYIYAPGKGAFICEGATIIAEIKGTSYPIGSACEADYELARRIANFLNQEGNTNEYE